jgi:outer membrane protein assembly factor BamB
MMTGLRFFTISLSLLVFLSSVPGAGAASQTEIEPGYYLIHWFNYDGAEVYLDRQYQGKISDSELLVAVDTTAPPYGSVSIRKEGHASYTGYLDSVPAPGEMVEVYPWYVQIEQPGPEGADGDRGWYVVHECSDGSSVYFDGKYMGEITDGELRVEVNVTAPGFTEYEVVEQDGWTGHTMSIQHVPPAGGAVHYYSWVQLAPHPTRTVPDDSPSPESLQDSQSPAPSPTPEEEGAGADECRVWHYGMDDYTRISLSSDGTVLAAGEPENGTIALMTAGGAPIWAYRANEGISGIGISGNGEYVAAATEDRTLLFFDAAGNLLWQSAIEGCSPKVVVSENGSICLVYTLLLPDEPYTTHTLQLFDRNGTEYFSKHIPAIDSAAIAPDEEHFVVGTSSFTRVRFYTTSGELLWNYKFSHPSYSMTNSRVALSDDRSVIATVDDDGIIGFDESGNELFDTRLDLGTSRPWIYVDVSADGTHILTGSQFVVYSLNRTGSLTWEFPLDPEIEDIGEMATAAISGDGERVAVGTRNTLFILDESGTVLLEYAIDHLRKKVVISDDGDVVVAGTSGGMVYISLGGREPVAIDMNAMPAAPLPPVGVTQPATPSTETGDSPDKNDAPLSCLLPVCALLVVMIAGLKGRH